MGLDSEYGETSCEEIDIGTAAKIAKEDAKDANEKQTAEIEVYTDEGCKQLIHKCKISGCGKAYSTEQELCHHEVTCCKETSFTCDTCKESFKKKSMLRIHMYLHQELSKRKKFSCPYDCCPKFYYVKASLTYHIKSVHEGKKFECVYPDCGKKLSTKASFLHHMMVHGRKEFLPHETVCSVIPEFMCDTCKRNFKTKGDLERHMSDHQDLPEKETCAYGNYKEHLTSEKDTQGHSCAQNGFPCDMCKKVSTTKINMQRHMTHHQREEFFCDMCKRKLKTKENMQRHMSLHRGKGFPCDICKKVFTRKENMHRHMSLHKGEVFPCDICKKILKTKVQLQTHISLHGKGFPCVICKAVFRTKGNMHRHMSLHNTEEFPCDTCKRILKTKEQMQKHISLHQRKVFTCDICKEIFSTMRSMHRHMSLHKQEEFCGSICKQILRTKKHMSCHQRQVFTCDMCKGSFTRGNIMQRQVCLHQTEVFPHVMCKKRFKEMAEVQRHMTDYKESSENTTFKLCICKRCFRTESFTRKGISLHRESSEKEKFSCDICKRVFKEKRSLRRHLLIHKKMSDRRVFCPHSNCSKSYANKWNLLCHIKCAHEEKKCKSTYLDHHKKLASKMVAEPQASEREREQMQEDTENLPISLTVAPEKFKQRNEVVQACGENPLTSVTAPQKYKKRREQLKKNKILHGSLNLESEECQTERKKVRKNIKIQTESLDDAPKNCDIAREALQDSEAQVKEAYDISSCKSENVVLSRKDFSEHDSEVVESRIDELQKERCNKTDSLNYRMDVREWIYLMKRIMEEIFPTVKSACL